MAIPSVITSGRVVGRYGVGIIDGPDEDDEPELLAAVGSTFTFRPDITGPLLYETPGGESITVALGEFTAVVNADGMLCTPVDPKANPLVAGRPWLRLPGNDTPGLRTTGWTWTVTPRMVTPAGTVLVGPTAPKPFSFTLAGGAEVDLTKVTKAPASPGISVEAATARAAAAEALAGQALAAVQELEENGLPGTPAATVESLPLGGPVSLLRASVSVAKTASRAVVVAFTGSSSTAGHNTAAAKRWVNLFASRITANPVLTDQQAYDQRLTLPAGVTVVNAGANGAASSTYLGDGRDTRLAALNPTFVVHMIGSNDYGSNVSQADYRANVLAAIERLDSLAAGPVHHLLIHSYARYDIAPTTRTWAQYGETLRAISAERPEHIAFLDLSGPFRAVGIPSTDPLGMMQSDKLHMNDNGHAYFAELVTTALCFAPVAGTPTAPTEPVLTAVVMDDFARADGPLGTTPVGSKPWLYSAGTLSLVGGLVTASAGNAGAFVDAGISNGTVGVTGSLSSQGLIFRASSTGEGYYFMWSGGGSEYRVGRRSALGAFTPITGTGTTRTFTSGARYEVEMNGSTIKCKVNGTTVLEITDSTYTGTHHGVVSASTTGAPLKDFRVTPVA